MKPIYFDLTVRDLGHAGKFFENAFGWRVERFPMPYEYYRIHAGSDNEPGIGWYATCAEPDGPVFGFMQADTTAK